MATQSIGLTGEAIVEVINGFTAAEQVVAAVAAEPGWTVVGALWVPVDVTAQLELIGLVTDAALAMTARLYNATDAAIVSGTAVSTSSLVDERKVSGAVVVAGGKLYQVQVEVVGPVAGLGVVRGASLLST